MASESETSASEQENGAENEHDNEITSEDRNKIRTELSTMSFEDLQKLKEKIGSKLYNQDVLGIPGRSPKKSFKRLNKNRPREMSSKVKPPGPVFSKKKAKTKERIIRDPRFDSLCGTFDKETFNTNYKFLNDVRKDERKKLVEELESTEDPKRKNQIKLLIQRGDNQMREHEKKEQERSKVVEEKREIRAKLKKGEKPVFKKKSEKRIENLVQKYEELKSSNKLQKHIEKRSKKLATKDRIRLEKNVNV